MIIKILKGGGMIRSLKKYNDEWKQWLEQQELREE
jgi:hypothetical protein